MSNIARALPSREFHFLFSEGAVTGLADSELLRRFTGCRDSAGELAFATLIARHGPMVLNVCRRMLQNPADAEDAFQATFLILVRRAGMIDLERSLGPWLYTVTVRVARRTQAITARRKHEPLDEATIQETSRPNSVTDHALRMTIDEMLARLPQKYRSAIVLCYLEGMTHEEAASRLQCPVGTIRSRLARGRALLKDRLARAGLAGPSAPFADGEAAGIRTVVPVPLIETTARTASRLAQGQALTEIVPSGLAQLVAGVLRSMTITKFTLVTAFLCAVSLVACGTLGLTAFAGDRKVPMTVRPYGARASGAERPPGINRGPRAIREPACGKNQIDRARDSQGPTPRGGRDRAESWRQ